MRRMRSLSMPAHNMAMAPPAGCVERAEMSEGEMPRSGGEEHGGAKEAGDGGRLEVVPGVVARGARGIERDSGVPRGGCEGRAPERQGRGRGKGSGWPERE